MEEKIDPKRVKRIDLEKMFQIHLDQFKLNQNELVAKLQLNPIKTAFYNGVVQALIAMNEMKEVFPSEQMNELLSDLMVQADTYFQKLSTEPISK